jgi:hypothetical protein
MTHTPEDQRLRERYATALMLADHTEATTLAERIGIPAPEQAAHWRTAHHANDEWQPENFDEFAALPPGRFDARVFDQTTYWVDVLRRPHRITDRDAFNDAYLLNVLDFITDEGWRWASDLTDHTSPETSILDGIDTTATPATIVVGMRANTTAILHATPLWKALIAEGHARGLDLGTHAA